MSPDHLNRYRDMADYADAKRILVKYQQPGDVAVLNADDPIVRTFADDTAGRVVPFSLDGPSHHAPSAYLAGEMLTWRTADDTAVPLVRVDDLQVPGRHNQANALCAAALALSAGVAVEDVQRALVDFWGVPDRQELVAVIDGVRYVNDTTATTPAATLAALEATAGPIVLIAGGADKRSDFSELAPHHRGADQRRGLAGRQRHRQPGRGAGRPRCPRDWAHRRFPGGDSRGAGGCRPRRHGLALARLCLVRHVPQRVRPWGAVPGVG